MEWGGRPGPTAYIVGKFRILACEIEMGLGGQDGGKKRTHSPVGYIRGERQDLPLPERLVDVAERCGSPHPATYIIWQSFHTNPEPPFDKYSPSA